MKLKSLPEDVTVEGVGVSSGAGGREAAERRRRSRRGAPGDEGGGVRMHGRSDDMDDCSGEYGRRAAESKRAVGDSAASAHHSAAGCVCGFSSRHGPYQLHQRARTNQEMEKHTPSLRRKTTSIIGLATHIRSQ